MMHKRNKTASLDLRDSLDRSMPLPGRQSVEIFEDNDLLHRSPIPDKPKAYKELE